MERSKIEQELARLPRIDNNTATRFANGHAQNRSTTSRSKLLQGANLRGRNLSNRDLTGVDLSGAQLVNANLAGADLTGTSLAGADLSRANLSGANLTGTDLRNAKLAGANFFKAKLDNALLPGANLLGARNLTTEQIATFNQDSATIIDTEIDITLPRLPYIRLISPATVPNTPPLSTSPGVPETPIPDKLPDISSGPRKPASPGRPSSAARKEPKTFSTLLTSQRQNDILLFAVIFVTILSLTPVLVLVGVGAGYSVLLGVFAALTVAAMVVFRPVTGFYVLAGCAVLIEQSSLQIPIGTDRLTIFYWPPSLAGLFERPIGFLILFILLAVILHGLIKRKKLLGGGKLFLPYLFFLACVAIGVVHGLTSGGDVKIIVVEVRPFWYLFVSYLLAYNLVTQKNHIRSFFWIVIIGAGIKGLQGTSVYLVVLHGNLVGQNEIMAHEDSFFFVALLLLVVLFSLYHNYRPQLYTALLVLPFVLIALVANQRRADYVAFLVGVGVAWTLIFLVKPKARKGLIIGMLIFLVVGGAYVAAFAHSSGGLAGPARAIITIVSPNSADPRDAASNLYRQIEDYDLKYTVRLNPILGLGFGKPFLQPVLLPDISTLDQYYNYVPHNTIYWVWMRLGPIGYLALWYLFGAIIVRGCLILRQLRDRYLQLVAIYIVAITFMEVIVAFADYQLFFYRNVIYLGLLAGILMKLPGLDDIKEQPVYESTDSVRRLTASSVGSQRAQLLSSKSASARA